MPHSRGMGATQKLSPHDERKVAVVAGCDPRTVRAYLAGKPQRSTVASRVKDALDSLGFAKALPQGEEREPDAA